MRTIGRITALGCVLAVMAIAVMAQDTSGSMNNGSNGQTMQKSLYDRLGGEAAIKAVVDDVAARAAADTRINAKFANTDMPRLKFHLVKQLCAVTGGPCKDIGRTQEQIHNHVGITSGEFDAFVEDLVATLDKLNVPAKEKSELLGILGPLKPKVIESDSSATGTPLPPNFKPAKPLSSDKMTEDKLNDKKTSKMKMK
ncbi:MAG: group I truncated hemoglobin [Pyrinomonadaceae bacterium]